MPILSCTQNLFSHFLQFFVCHKKIVSFWFFSRTKVKIWWLTKPIRVKGEQCLVVSKVCKFRQTNGSKRRHDFRWPWLSVNGLPFIHVIIHIRICIPFHASVKHNLFFFTPINNICFYQQKNCISKMYTPPCPTNAIYNRRIDLQSLQILLHLVYLHRRIVRCWKICSIDSKPIGHVSHHCTWIKTIVCLKILFSYFVHDFVYKYLII